MLKHIETCYNNYCLLSILRHRLLSKNPNENKRNAWTSLKNRKACLNNLFYHQKIEVKNDTWQEI